MVRVDVSPVKVAWVVLLLTALTDFVLSFGTALSAAMVVNQVVGMPSAPAILISAIGGLMVACRTIQQALKTTPIFTASLKGEDPPIIIPATTATRLAAARMVIAPAPDPHSPPTPEKDTT